MHLRCCDKLKEWSILRKKNAFYALFAKSAIFSANSRDKSDESEYGSINKIASGQGPQILTNVILSK